MTLQIHELVASEHDAAGIKYVLLVGTYDQVPTKYVYSPSSEYGYADFNYKPTDWYYGVPKWNDSTVGLMGGNIPEIAVGRLPVKNADELERTLAKIVDVETNLKAGPILVFGDTNVALDSPLGAPYVFYSADVNVTSESLTHVLSSGPMHVISYSHGTASALWTGDPKGGAKLLMSYEQVPQINSTYGIQYIIACFTGALDLGNESLARTLITSQTGPALVVASSRIEMSGNMISSRFWKAMSDTGNVGSAIIEALSSYLLDQAIFQPGEYAFQYYNSYLDKVVYGDVSWTVRTQEGGSSLSSYDATQSSSQTVAAGKVQTAGETVGPTDLLTWFSGAGTLAGSALIAGVHIARPKKRPSKEIAQDQPTRSHS